MAPVHLECGAALVSACIMSGPDLHTPQPHNARKLFRSANRDALSRESFKWPFKVAPLNPTSCLITVGGGGGSFGGCL